MCICLFFFCFYFSLCVIQCCRQIIKFRQFILPFLFFRLWFLHIIQSEWWWCRCVYIWLLFSSLLLSVCFGLYLFSLLCFRSNSLKCQFHLIRKYHLGFYGMDELNWNEVQFIDPVYRCAKKKTKYFSNGFSYAKTLMTLWLCLW